MLATCSRARASLSALVLEQILVLSVALHLDTYPSLSDCSGHGFHRGALPQRACAHGTPAGHGREQRRAVQGPTGDARVAASGRSHLPANVRQFRRQRARHLPGHLHDRMGTARVAAGSSAPWVRSTVAQGAWQVLVTLNPIAFERNPMRITFFRF